MKWTFGFHIINLFDRLYKIQTSEHSTHCGLVLRWQFVNSPKTVVPTSTWYTVWYGCFVRFLVLSDLIQTSWLCLVTSIEYMFIIKCQMIFFINVVSVLLYTPQYWCIKKTNNSKHSNYMYLLCRDLPQGDTLPSWIFSSSKKLWVSSFYKKPLLYYRFLIHEINTIKREGVLKNLLRKCCCTYSLTK